MRFLKKAAVSLVVAVLAAGLYFTVGKAAAAEPGSSGDPVVTKSYVDQKINELTQFVTSLSGGSGTSSPNISAPSSNTSGNISNEELMRQIDFIVQERLSEASGTVTGGTITGGAVTFKTLSVPAGKRVLSTEEGTEFILRSGTATIVGAENGVADVTDGKDLMNGQAAPRDHHLIAPRAGRGLSFTKDSWIMVRGEYEIR